MRRSLTITLCALFALWLCSLAVLILYVAALVALPALVGAIVAQIGVWVTSAAILLATNVRRPHGIDPDAPDAAPRARILLSDGNGYGGRETDDRSVVNRLSEILEAEADKRPGPARTPDWARGVADRHAEIGIERGDDES